MLVRRIDNVLIDLIGNHIAVVPYDDICYRLKFLTCKDLATGIRRIAEHQCLSTLSECILYQVGIERKYRRHERDVYRLSTAQDSVCRIVLIER